MEMLMGLVDYVGEKFFRELMPVYCKFEGLGYELRVLDFTRLI
jgi:hypothetical protein